MGGRAAESDGNARGGDPYHFGRVERGTAHAVANHGMAMRCWLRVPYDSDISMPPVYMLDISQASFFSCCHSIATQVLTMW